MSGRLTACLVPPVLAIATPEGSTTLNVIVQVLPPVALAVTVELPARSPAVNTTLFPLVDESRPPPLTVHCAGPEETVTVTSSPTPILVRPRLDGDVATVSDVREHGGGGGGGGAGGFGGDAGSPTCINFLQFSTLSGSSHRSL